MKLATFILITAGFASPVLAQSTDYRLFDDFTNAHQTSERSTAANLDRSIAGLSASDAARQGGRIVGGTINVEQGRHEFSVFIEITIDNKKFACGGSLVKPNISGDKVEDWLSEDRNPTWIVTAAHCLTSPADGWNAMADDLKIVAGNRDLSPTANVYRISVGDPIIHPDYNSETHENDIALVPITEITPPPDTQGTSRPHSIQLPARHMISHIYQPLSRQRINGWGRTSEGGRGSDRLLVADVPIYPADRCAIDYSTFGAQIPDSHFCAGYSTGGIDSCQGDSGGAIYFDDATNPVMVAGAPVLTGVVSWGIGCARAGFAGVYTSVAAMQSWLENTAAAN